MSATPTAPALWSLPDPIPLRFATERVVLRAWDAADAAALWMAVDESRPTLHPWLPWAREDNLSIAQTHHTIERFRRDLNKGAFDAGRLNLVVGVFDAGSGRVLGGTGFHTFRPAAHQAEIGYWVRSSDRGRGVCTHATAAIISWAFTAPERGGWGLRRVEIVCAAGNAPSSGVCERLGLRQQSRSQGDRWVDGRGWDDTLKFAACADEWDAEAMRRREASADTHPGRG